ncbi:hypothetical protein HN51_001466, partial [Arachis hypogaea]
QLCMPGTLDPAKARGKIVMCLRGAVGVVMENDAQSGNTVLAEPHILSTTNVPKNNQDKNVHDYYNSTTSPTINMSAARTLLGTKPAPVMASFSSRGPNPIQPSILK